MVNRLAPKSKFLEVVPICSNSRSQSPLNFVANAKYHDTAKTTLQRRPTSNIFQIQDIQVLHPTSISIVSPTFFASPGRQRLRHGPLVLLERLLRQLLRWLRAAQEGLRISLEMMGISRWNSSPSQTFKGFTPHARWLVYNGKSQ